jgi:hypothetical protein
MNPRITSTRNQEEKVLSPSKEFQLNHILWIEDLAQGGGNLK